MVWTDLRTKRVINTSEIMGNFLTSVKNALGISTTITTTDIDTDGNWKFTIDNGDLLIQKRESGNWNTKGAISPNEEV